MNGALAAAGLGSLLFHGALLWALLHPGGRGMPQVVAAEPPSLEVQFVDQAAETEGAAAAAPAAPPPVAEQTRLPDAEAGQEASPPPPAPASTAPPAPPSQQRVNLDGGEQDRDPLLVTGDDVVPPRPEDTVRNRPPAYPADAARRHAQGTVGLMVHVTAGGTPAWVDVTVSSGDQSLDAAARDAVALWRFRPATSGGLAVPFDFAYNIRFTLGGDRRTHDQDRPRLDPGR